MIEEDKIIGDFDITCDNCGEYINIDSNGDFRAMIAELKELGWSVVKNGDEWKHYCPECGES